MESRAYSGLTPDTPIDKHRKEFASLPFNEGTLATAGDSKSELQYAFTSSPSGARFAWDAAQAHDGARESFSVAEGELAFSVDVNTPFAFSGDYHYQGPGVKRLIYRLYDSPADIVPVFQWDQGTSTNESSSFAPNGSGELLPGVGYRLFFRLLLDNPAVTEPAAVSADLAFTIGAPDNPPLAGDTDGNGRVDVTDLNHVRNNFGAQGNPVLGDTHPFDGAVDIGDLNAVRNNFGAERGGSVPEPGALGLLIATFAALAIRSTANPWRGMMRSRH